MSAILRKSSLISPEEYLAGELNSQIKHEYLGGIVYAMAGARNVHSVIIFNILLALGNRLRGQKCQPFPSDTKVRVIMPSGQIRFYYPDVQIVCDQNSLQETFQERPVVLIEVLSPSTRRTDEHEKLEAYTTISTLETYLLVDSNQRQITVYQRSSLGFECTVYSGEKDRIRLPSLNLEIPITEFYENAVLLPPTIEELEEYGN